jgi:hypothetical protein
MATLLNKQNLVISAGEYQKDGATKKEWKTIGEIITMQGDDGQPFQFFKMWGAGGVVEGKPQYQPQQGFAPQQQQHPQNAAYSQPQGQPQQGGQQAPYPDNQFDNSGSIPF